MLRSLKVLRGYHVQAYDGPVGTVEDFYFDDEAWTVRYLIVDTGHFLSGRKALIASASLGEPEWADETFPVNHTKQVIEDSPSIDTDMPVSRQEERALHTHYQLIPYWPVGSMAGHPMAVPVEQKQEEEVPGGDEEGDPHLRSLDEVIGYHIKAPDGQFGHLADFIVDDASWALRYFVVDTRDFLPGKHVLLAVDWIRRVVWHDRVIETDLSKKAIEGAPEFDPSRPVNEETETVLYDYYGRPREFV